MAQVQEVFNVTIITAFYVTGTLSHSVHTEENHVLHQLLSLTVIALLFFLVRCLDNAGALTNATLRVICYWFIAALAVIDLVFALVHP